MLITCPSCASEYVIDPAHLRPSGRTVRCASCRTTFFAAVEPEAPSAASNLDDDLGFAEDDIGFATADRGLEAMTREAVGEVFEDAFARASDDGAAFADPDDVTFADERDLVVDAQSRRSAPGRARRGAEDAATAPKGLAARLASRLRAAGAPAFALLALTLLAYGVFARESVVRAAPDMAAVYRLVGLEVNLRGLALERVVSTRFEADGTRVLEVEGVVSNVTDTPRDVPELALSLRDDTHTALYSWTVEAPRATLGPGESAPFRARLVAPPAEARQVLVRFAPASRATLAQSGH